MTNPIKRIRENANRFTISGAIFAAGFLAIAFNGHSVDPAPAQFAESIRPDYSELYVNVNAVQIAHDAEQERLKQLTCVAQTIWGEARSESALGMTAVAEVIRNRVKSHRYPDTYCGVVYQPKQFSMWNKGDPNGAKAHAAFDAELPSPIVLKSIYIANQVMEGRTGVIPNKALHYHTTEVSPYWSRSKKLAKYETVGAHIFYVKNTANK